LDADQVEASSYTEAFERIFPYYLAIGMTYEQFWCDMPELVIFYRRADEIRKRRVNEELWLAGIYTGEALASTVGNMFSKSKYEYPSEPKPITMAEIEERRERDRKAKAEAIKAKFMARALSINANMGAEK
jgi:hypothetical protein